MDAAEAISILTSSPAVQTAFTTLALLTALWPKQASVKDGDSFDFIVVGCGTAGSVIANRLTEVGCFNVLCIEAGGDPPLTSMLPLLFPLMKRTPQDWNYRSQDDGYTGQNLIGKVIELTSGKMLGGSSSLDYMFYVRGSPSDFDPWVEVSNDKSWGWDELQQYFKKSEKLLDKKILNSSYNSYHGTNGYLKVAREPHKETIPYLNAFDELGLNKVLDLTGGNNIGFAEPLFTIYDYRQSNAYAFLTPIRDRCNLNVLKNSQVKRIIFEGNIAIGVEVIINNNESITLRAKKEVIVSAGTFNSAQLLMLSGIGPRQHLESMGINVIADLPVGENFQDHASVTILHRMDKSSIPVPPPNPFMFPDPAFTGFVALNKSQSYPDYQVLTAIVPHDSQYQIFLFCTIVFGYKDAVCSKIYEANVGRNLMYTILSSLHSVPAGRVLLRSADPADPPLIFTGAYKDEADLNNHAKYVQDFNRVVNTSYFKSVGAKFVALDLPECANLKVDSAEYWRCYTLSMSTTTYQYSGTCSMGKVVDNELKVKGLKRLRVADSSIMPTTVSATLKAAVNAIAEKAADMIKKDNTCEQTKICNRNNGSPVNLRNILRSLFKMK